MSFLNCLTGCLRKEMSFWRSFNGLFIFSLLSYHDLSFLYGLALKQLLQPLNHLRAITDTFCPLRFCPTQMLRIADESLNDEMRLLLLWNLSLVTPHTLFIHKKSLLKPVHIFMVKNSVSKSCLMAELCFHRFVHFGCVLIHMICRIEKYLRSSGKSAKWL